LPFQPRAFLHDAGIVLSRLRVERDGAPHAVLLHYLDEPPDADAVAVVAARVIAHVGRAAADLPVEMLDIGNDPDRDLGAVRPGEWRMIDDGAIWKQRKRVGLVHPMLLPAGGPARS